MIVIGLLSVGYIDIVKRQNADEAAHIATGMEWLQYGTYQYERLHPPLARAVLALPLYLQGVRVLPLDHPSPCSREFVAYYHQVERDHKNGGFASQCLNDADLTLLDRKETPPHALQMARAMAGIFYVIAVLFTYLLVRELFNRDVALIATILMALMPLMIRYTALVMTDVPMFSGYIASLYFWVRFLKYPDLRNMLIAATVIALAFLTKYSLIVFLAPAIVMLSIALRWPSNFSSFRTNGEESVLIKHRFLSRFCSFEMTRTETLKYTAFSIICLLWMLLLTWSVFGFSLSVPAQVIPTNPPLTYEWAQQKILPLGEVVQGFFELAQKNRKGHNVGHWQGHYFKNAPTWLYYPFSLLVETPTILLVAFLVGCGLIIRQPSPLGIAFLAIFSATLAIGMKSNIQINLHHLLPIQLSIVVIASLTLHELWQQNASGRRLVMLLLVIYATTFWQDDRNFYGPTQTIINSLIHEWRGTKP